MTRSLPSSDAETPLLTITHTFFTAIHIPTCKFKGKNSKPASRDSTYFPAATAYEITLPCESLDNLYQLYSDMGMTDETPDDVMHSVCHPTMPDAGNVWDGVVEKSGEWLDRARGAM